MTARMARKYLTWRRLPRCWAVFRWRSTALRYKGDMVKRMQHIGTFLHNEMGISLRGISPMCGRSSIHLQKIFFLRSIARTLGGLGAFIEGQRQGEGAPRLATLEGRGATPVTAHGCLGELYLAQGDLEQAIRVYDQGLAFCRASDNRSGFWRVIVGGMGYAAALQGRLAEDRE